MILLHTLTKRHGSYDRSIISQLEADVLSLEVPECRYHQTRLLTQPPNPLFWVADTARSI